MVSGNTTLIISNEEMNDIMQFVQSLEDSNIFIKGVTKTIKNEAKEQKEEFLSILLGTLGASLLGNLLTGKGILRAVYGRRSLNSSTLYRPLSCTSKNNKGKGIVRAGSGNNKRESDF